MESLSAVITQLLPYVNKRARQVSADPSTQDELYQLCLLTLGKLNSNPLGDDPALMKKIAVTAINNRIRDYIRSENTYRGHIDMLSKLNSPYISCSHEEAVELDEITSILKNEFTAQQLHYYEGLLEGKSEVMLREELGLSRRESETYRLEIRERVSRLLNRQEK